MWQKARAILVPDVFLVPTEAVTWAGRSEGEVESIPTRLLIDVQTKQFISLGQTARSAEHAGLFRTAVVVPTTGREIADDKQLIWFLRGVLEKVFPQALLKPRVALSVPIDTSEFMKEVWVSSLLQAGAREVLFVHPLLAVAAGAGLPYQDSHGYVVGSWESNKLSLALVAFGHVQVEWQSSMADKKEIRSLWSEFVSRIPADFQAQAVHEGILLSIEKNSHDPDIALYLSQKSQTPVGVIDRSEEINGLRAIVKERG